MLESHARLSQQQLNEQCKNKRKKKKKKKKEQPRGDKTEVPPWDGQQWNYWGEGGGGGGGGGGLN